MKDMFEYLNEREEYFFPNESEEIEEPEDSVDVESMNIIRKFPTVVGNATFVDYNKHTLLKRMIIKLKEQ
jgi:hypothetical protein